MRHRKLMFVIFLIFGMVIVFPQKVDPEKDHSLGFRIVKKVWEIEDSFRSLVQKELAFKNEGKSGVEKEGGSKRFGKQTSNETSFLQKEVRASLLALRKHWRGGDRSIFVKYLQEIKGFTKEIKLYLNKVELRQNEDSP